MPDAIALHVTDHADAPDPISRHTKAIIKTIRVDPELANLIPPLTREERAQLENNLRDDGCLTPILVWQRSSTPAGTERIVLDGHNRFEICQRENIDFNVEMVETVFDLASAKEWVIKHQLGRRNLTLAQRCELVSQLRPRIAAQAKEQQGQRTDLLLNSSKGSEPINTRQELADQASVSSDSYAKWEYVQEHGDQQTKDRLARKEISLHRAYKETIPGVKRAKKAADLNARTTTARRVDHPDGWHLGDWRDHVDALEDESVSLVLADPPYGIGFQSDHRADRSKPRKHQKITNDDPAQAMAEIGAAMAALLPKLKPDAHLYCFCHWRTEPQVREVLEAAGLKLRGSLIWVKNNTGMGDTLTTHAPLHERILHLVKGSPVLIDRDPDVFHFDRVNSNRHPTEKPVDLLKRLIEITTVTGELVADPFGGVASVAVAAKEVGRKSWSVEVDENFYEIGSERLKTSETPNVGDEVLTKENIEDGQT